jgi:hypothetical protein
MNPDRKCSESAQLDAITAHQRSGNFIEDSTDDCLDFLTLQVLVLVPYAPNKVGPNHGRFLLGRIIAGTGALAQFAGQSADLEVMYPRDKIYCCKERYSRDRSKYVED